jgi:hypothetical protein
LNVIDISSGFSTEARDTVTHLVRVGARCNRAWLRFVKDGSMGVEDVKEQARRRRFAGLASSFKIPPVSRGRPAAVLHTSVFEAEMVGLER